ncbi:MAG: asparagine synthase (glutamine-hydrolyzing) [Thermodesulfobacteriota bacterium]|nr:asparagine synthase (glutamine-hydrolyzing) [Thermodesulfobacteriota bacterium]
MCGIAGYFLNNRAIDSSRAMDLLLDPIRARGPDDEGVCLVSRRDKSFISCKTDFTVPSLGERLPHFKDKLSVAPHDLSLVHTRYAIIDLSEAGHQPFVSNDKGVVGVFNGEIYNYVELRDELTSLGVRFRTSSDTEVLIEGYCFWGDALWPKMNGFWAVAIYDFRNDAIVFSRDRIGVAPLYYREMPNGFFFCSSIQGLYDLDPEGIELDDDVVLGFAQTGIKDHEDTTFYKQIRSLPASSTVLFPTDRYRVSEAQSRRYWDFPSSRLKVDDISFGEAVQSYRETFFRAVQLRLRADVKVAFELSGGLDSSSVVAAAALLRNNDVTTYTAKVKDADEEPYARSILKSYPVDYRVLENLEGGFREDHQSFSRVMEEPYDNPNDYTHHKMLRRMKAEGVSVVVTGAGGDEILAGYEGSFWPKAYPELKTSGFFWQADWYEFCRRFKTLKETCKTLHHYVVDSLKYLGNWIGTKRQMAAQSTATRALAYQRQYRRLSFHDQGIYHFKVALVPYYMRSSDHFTMSIPIEHRFPLLDYRMVELCMQMPITYLFKGGWTKYLLRKAMEPYLPRKIVWRRKKMGFTFPYHRYFSANRSTFKPLLEHLRAVNFPTEEFGTYDQLLERDPALLWRVLSIAIWAKGFSGAFNT